MTINLSEDQRIKIINSQHVFGIMREILLREEMIDQEKEHFWMIGLAENNMIIFVELVSLGSINATTVEPMNVFRMAVIKGVVKVIFVHNHPSGELKPSEADKDLTDRLIQVGRILNIEAIDHLIISTSGFMSFADTGLFEQLKHSLKWVPLYEIKERMLAEHKKIREQAVMEAEERGLKNVAQKMRKEKIPLDLIVKVMGLTEEEIKGI